MPQPRVIAPDKGFRPGLNESGADIAKSVFVSIDAAGSVPDSVILPTAGGEALGVTAQVLANTTPNSRGDVQIQGRAVVLVGAGGVTAGAEVSADVAGAAVLAGTSGWRILGKAITTAAATEFAEIELATAGLGPTVP